MGRSKLKRFDHNAKSRNVIEEGKEIFGEIKGNWHEFFGNKNPIVLELGCGRGEYTTGLAAVYPDKNFIGVDVKGARLWKGSTVAIQNNLDNAAFLRIRMYQILDFFEKGEVDEIWMTFPDPRLKEGDEKHRMTNPEYITKYRGFLKKGGVFHLKTDSYPFYAYTKEVAEQPELGIEILTTTEDLYSDPELLAQHFGIQTTYEKKFLGQGIKINYLKMRL